MIRERLRTWLTVHGDSPSPHTLKKYLIQYLEWSRNWNFDAALRYAPIVERLHVVARKGNPKILEIGTHLHGITAFLKRPIFGLDLNFGPRPTHSKKLLIPVVGSTLNLPYKARCFDFVLAVDVLEHLPARERVTAVDEMLKALSPQGLLCLAVPCDEPSARFEKRLNALTKRLTGEGNMWIEEHIDNGLPHSRDIIGMLTESAKANGICISIQYTNNVNLKTWIVYQGLFLIPGFSLINRIFFRPLFVVLKRMNMGICYRKIFFVTKLPGS